MQPLVPSPASPRPRWHPLVVACLLVIVVRAIGVVSHAFSRDPNGNVVSAAPFETLLVAIPNHGQVLLTGAGLLLLLWLLLPSLRPLVTAVGVALAAAAIVLGQVDLAMQWFIGERFSPMAADTYGGGGLLSADVLAPLRFQPRYFATRLALMLVPLALIAVAVARAARGAPTRPPARWMIVTLFVLASLCRIPLEIAYGHQRDALRPPELLFAADWLGANEVPAPADEEAAVARLRAQVDPTGTSRWVDPRLPIARVPGARNRWIGETVPAERPDIVVFAIESLRALELGYVPGNVFPEGSPTPRLDALARRGVVFARYLATGNPTPRGFFGINTGVVDHRESFIVSGSTTTEFDALPDRLRRAGYRTLGFWGANPSFDNQLFWANQWYDRIRHPEPAGALALVKPVGDDRLITQVLEEIAAHDRAGSGQPLFAYVATGDTHEPYVLLGETDLPADTVRAVAAEKDTRRRYRRVLRSLDAQIGRVLDALERRETGRPTVIVVVGDHADAAGDSIPPEMRDLPNDGVEWTAALIVAPPEWIGPVPRVETFPSGHADLMPTLLGFVGDRGPTIAMGTDLFADVPAGARTAVSVSGQGYRLDRNGWSLFVRRDHPEAVYTKPIEAPIAAVRPGLAGSPFTADDALRLWENMNTWTWLIEQDRVWRSSLMPPAARACGSSTPSAAGASAGCPPGSTPP